MLYARGVLRQPQSCSPSSSSPLFQEDGLAEVHDKIAQEMPFPERRLRGVFEELGQGCSKFVSLVRGTGGGSAAGKTKLDKERHKLLVREMVSIEGVR